MPAERVEEGRVELLEDLLLATFHEPCPVVTAHELVREAVVAYLAALALLDQVLEVLGDLLGVVFGVDRVRERRHGARHGVERRAGPAEREVVVVGEAVEVFLRLLREAGVHAPERGRQLRERLEDALVAEVLRHEREEIRLGVLETESVEQPPDVRLRDRHVRRRRPERQPANERGNNDVFHRGDLLKG